MGILEVITVVLLVLKLTLYPEWSWLLVASPILVAFAIYMVLIVIIYSRGITLIRRKRK